MQFYTIYIQDTNTGANSEEAKAVETLVSQESSTLLLFLRRER